MTTEHNNAVGSTNLSEKDSTQGTDHATDPNAEHTAALKTVRTASSVTISPELFEKLYLSPQNVVQGDLRKTFGNPTPIALIGFVVSLGPLSADLIGWRGAGGTGAAGIGSYYYFGGLLLVLGGFLEFILGNTFPSVVASEAAGLDTVGFNSSFAFFLIFIAALSFVFLILSIRTNVIFVIIFTLVIFFGLLSGVYWQSANGIGNADPLTLALAGRIQKAAGPFLFITDLAGWYLIFAILFTNVDFPIQLPVGDLSTLVKGASERARARDHIV